jgi:CRISPR/Cas system CSM-associated protein Csm2 small subunit
MTEAHNARNEANHLLTKQGKLNKFFEVVNRYENQLNKVYRELASLP